METLEKYYVADLVADIGSLPSVAARIVSLTAEADCDLAELARVISTDTVLSMRFLSVANTAVFSRGQEIRDLQTALARLGLRRVRNLALFMGLHDMTPAEEADGPLSSRDFWKHSLATASSARALARLRNLATPDDAWLTGLLHGIGVLSLGQKAPVPFHAAVAEARERRVSLATAEMTHLDFHHGELGGRLLARWGLPPVFAEAVEFLPEDYAPEEVSPAAHTLIGLARDAILLVRATGYGESGEGTPVPALDAALSEALGLDDRTLTELAAIVDQEVSEMADLAGIDRTRDTFQAALDTVRDQAARLGLEGIDEGLARERLEHELALARQIQQNLIPRSAPHLSGCHLAALNRPSLQTSGDFYDFIPFADGRLALVIADVSGKGISAALLGATVQATLRALAQVSADPGHLLAQANNALFTSSDPEHFATLFLAVIDADGAGFHYASAAHDPPLLRTAIGRITWLPPAGTPLGLFPDVTYPVTRVPLSPGDLLVAYTDGLTEAQAPDGGQFGRDGLAGAVADLADSPPDDLLPELQDAVLAHAHPATGDPVLADDLTLVVLGRKS